MCNEATLQTVLSETSRKTQEIFEDIDVMILVDMPVEKLSTYRKVMLVF